MFGLEQQYHDCSHVNEPQEVARCLLVPGRNSPELLDPVDEPLGEVAFLISMFIILSLENPILLRRDHHFRPTRLDRRDELIPVISLIRDHSLGIMTFDQGRALVDVGLLSAGQDELDGVPQTVRRRCAAWSKPPRERPELGGAPFFAAPAACWWARITVLSRISDSRSGSFKISKTPSQTPLADERSYRLQAEFDLPNLSGRSREGARVLPIQSTASMKSRLSLAVTPGSPARPGGGLRSVPSAHPISRDDAWLSARWIQKRDIIYLYYENLPALVHTP